MLTQIKSRANGEVYETVGSHEDGCEFDGRFDKSLLAAMCFQTNKPEQGILNAIGVNITRVDIEANVEAQGFRTLIEEHSTRTSEYQNLEVLEMLFTNREIAPGNPSGLLHGEFQNYVQIESSTLGSFSKIHSD